MLTLKSNKNADEPCKPFLCGSKKSKNALTQQKQGYRQSDTKEKNIEELNLQQTLSLDKYSKITQKVLKNIYKIAHFCSFTFLL